MFNISNNNHITITRGDSAETILYINLGTNIEPLIYDLGKDDIVYFGVMEPNQTFEHAILKKIFTYKDYDFEQHYLKIKFNPEDTEHLVSGKYYYSIKLFRPAVNIITEASKVDTIISPSKFIIIE